MTMPLMHPPRKNPVLRTRQMNLPPWARGRVALEQILSGGTLPSRREHQNEAGMTALDTIMGEVDDLSRDR